MIQEALYKVTHGQDLSYDLAKDTMNKIMSGDVAEVPMAGFLCALAAKGPTVDEVTAFAEVMREKAGSVPHARSEEHTSELQSHYSISYAVFCLKKKKK